MRGYLRELNISDADVGGSGPDLYELSGPFLDFFLFFDRTSNNHSSSGSSAEVRGAGGATEELGAKEDRAERGSIGIGVCWLGVDVRLLFGSPIRTSKY